MKITGKFASLTLVAALGLTACGDGKSRKKDAAVEVPQTTDVAPAEKTPETVTAVESSQPTEVVVVAKEEVKPEVAKEEVKPEVPAVPEGGKTDQKDLETDKDPETDKGGDAVLCTADVITFCVKVAKGSYEEVSFGRSAPECKFPEAPAAAVDIELCRPDFGGSKTK